MHHQNYVKNIPKMRIYDMVCAHTPKNIYKEAPDSPPTHLLTLPVISLTLTSLTLLPQTSVSHPYNKGCIAIICMAHHTFYFTLS